jgi:hypothetical protein
VTRPFADEAVELAVLAITPGSRVLVVGATPPLTAALADRGCSVEWSAVEGDPVDALLVHGPVSPDSLAAAASRLAGGGRVVVTAANVTHGAVRLALLQGRFPGAGEGPVVDREALERLFDSAGLVVLDRLEIGRDLDETGVDLDLDAFKPELIAALDDDPDARVAAFVFVGRRAGEEASAKAGEPGGVSLAEELQDRLRRAELDAARARNDADARGERVQELEEALRARMSELEDLHRELAHARMDLELKDAYSLEMRTLAEDREVQAHHTRLEAQALQRSVDHLQANLLEAHALLAARTGELAVARADADRLATELDAVTRRASYQIVDGTTRALGRFRPAVRLARGVARRVGRLAGRGA